MAKWAGKILGGVLGALLGGPSGAAVGAGLGHLVDEKKQGDDSTHGAEIESVRLRSDAFEEGTRGISVKVTFRTEGCKDTPCLLRVTFLDGDGDPIPLSTSTELLERSAEPIAVIESSFTPSFDAALYEDAELFMPFAALALEITGSGWVQIEVLRREGSRVLSRRREPLIYPAELDDESRWFLPEGEDSAADETDEESSLVNDSRPELAPEYIDLLDLMVGCALADGPVRPEELRTIRAFFRRRLKFTARELVAVSNQAGRLMRDGCDPLSPRRMAEELDDGMKRALVDLLWDVARSDGQITDDERGFIRRVVSQLRIPGSSVELEFPQEERRRAVDLAALGLSPHDPPDRAGLKAAYRELLMKYHPDRVAHLGEELQELAHQKLVKINEAYARLFEKE